MDRCALFVDAGYVLADGAMSVHGTRRRESVSWDYGGLLQLLGGLAMERSRLPLLRCYWYEATVEGRRSVDHDVLADLPGVKLRLAKMRPGRREGVESEIHRDLTTLARNKAVSDAMVVSAEEDLAQVISDVQDLGMRVTLLNIAVDGDWTISRTLRQECDDIVEISSAHLRPYVELISGAEPPRSDERDGTLVALRPNVNGNGNGTSAGRAVPYAQPSPRPMPAATDYPGSVPGYAASAVPEYQATVPPLSRPLPDESARLGNGTVPADGAAPQEQAARQDQQPDLRAVRRGQQEPPRQDSADAVSEPAGGSGYPGPGEYPTAVEYGSVTDYGAVPDFMPAPYDSTAAQSDAQQQGRQNYVPRPGGARAELTARAELPPRPESARGEDLYPAPVVLPASGAELPADPPPARQSQGADLSGYNPGTVRDQFHSDAVHREPVAADGDRYQPMPVAAPAGNAQVRRLPARGPQPLPAAVQPAPAAAVQHPTGQGSAPVQSPPAPPTAPVPGLPLPGRSAPGAVQGTGAQPVAGSPSGGQPIAPVVPMDPSGAVYGSPRGGSYPGQVPVAAGSGSPTGPTLVPHGAPMTAPGQSAAISGPPAMPDGSGQGVPVSGPHPGLSPVTPVGSAALHDAAGTAGSVGQAGPAGYSGGQGAVSLADAVQSAHEEGQAFGDSVARDAPALWLEAVLARKPRMPSDLEARLLQGSALPIDFLLHDEVRHALRRGFWDALERARR